MNQSTKAFHMSKAKFCINCEHVFEGTLINECPVCASKTIVLVNNWLAQASLIATKESGREFRG